MYDIDLILTLTGGLTAALIFGYVTHRLGLSPIVGYPIGGTLLGPHTSGLVVDANLAEQMAEIGVILLMFGVGLQFHIEELLPVRGTALPGALLTSPVAAALGYLVAITSGASWQGAIVFGVALSVASTVVLVRGLADNRDLHTPKGHVAVGWLVVEDNDVEPTVVELNMATVRELKAEGIDAVYGDASHPGTLRAAGVAGASVLILTSADIEHTEEVIKTAREQNAGLRVMARTTHLRERDKLKAAGADLVFSGEGEVALAFTESILFRLGATAEQIDRERGRVHAELFGTGA